MITYQTPEFMANLLQEAQKAQVTVLLLNDGHSLHIDTSSNENYFYSENGHHAGFGVTLFDHTDIVADWDFNSNDDADSLNHILEDLKFKISRL